MFITSFSPFQSWKQASAKSQSSAESFNFNAEMGNLTKRLELAKISASAGRSEGCLVGIKRIIPQGTVTCSETPIKTIQAKMLPLKEIVVLSFYQQCFPLHFNYLVWVTSTSATSISESTNGDVVHLHQLPGL